MDPCCDDNIILEFEGDDESDTILEFEDDEDWVISGSQIPYR